MVRIKSHKKIFYLFLATLGTLLLDPLMAQDKLTTEDLPQIFQSIVQVRNESFLNESLSKPWLKESIGTGFGSGVIIEGNKILTNAHVIRGGNYITVRNYNKRKVYPAKISFLAVDCDLALLEVEDSEFFEGTSPVSISNTYPTLGSDLLILGFPGGNENLTVESGKVVSFEKGRYSYSGLDIRNVIKVSANIQPGNSGGPAIKKGKIVGLVFQISQVSQNIAYLIPTDIILHFLKDIEDGKYDGFPALGIEFQPGNNPSLKSYYKIPDNIKGVLINTIYPGSPFFELLKPGDYLYKVDEYTLNYEGEIIQEKKIYIMDYVESKFIGENLTVYFIRDGKKYKTTSILNKLESIEMYRDENNDYYLNAGMVFQPISKTLFLRKEPYPIDSSARYYYSYFIQDRLYRWSERDIVLTYIFEDPENFRYRNLKYKIVESINGINPRNLEHFKEIWINSQSIPIVIQFRDSSLPVVITPENRRKINIRVQKRFGAKNNEPN